MKVALLALLLALSVCGSSLGAVTPQGGSSLPEVGQAFPVLEFPQLGEDGRTSLAAFRGRKVLLIQFASW